MTIFRLLSLSAALPALLLLSGCGGAGVQAVDGRGDGNIPIGRLSSVQGPVSVSEWGLNQASPSTVDGQGTIWASRMLPGSVTVTIVSGSGTSTLPVILGVQQSYVVDAYVNLRPRNASVTGLTISLTNGDAPIVGNSYPVVVTVSGTNVSGLKPNVWVDNGVGSFDVNHNFVAGTAGTGVIRAELFGVTASLPITVH